MKENKIDKQISKYICSLVMIHEKTKKYLVELMSNSINQIIEVQDKQSKDDVINSINQTALAQNIYAVDVAFKKLKFKQAQHGDKLARAVKLNCEDKRKFNFETLDRMLGLHISRSTFYRRKREFIKNIAEQLYLVKVGTNAQF